MMQALRDEHWADLIGVEYSQENDCWGITKKLYARRGVVVEEPGVAALDPSADVVGSWKRIPRGQEEPGDVAAWATKGKGIDHVAPLLTNGLCLHARKGQRATASIAPSAGFVGWFRPIPAQVQPEMVADRSCGRVNCRFAADFNEPHRTSPYVCPAGWTAEKMLPPGLTLDDVFVSVHGARIDNPDTYVPKSGDVVLFVQKPKGLGALAAGAITGLEGGFIFGAVSFVVNSVIAIGLSYLVSLISSKPEVSREEAPADDSPTFNLGGIRNSVAPGSTVGIVFGEHRVGGQIIGIYNSISDLVAGTGANPPCIPTGSLCLPAPPQPVLDNSFGPDSFVTVNNTSTVSGGKTALNVLIAVSEGPVESVNGFTEDNDEVAAGTVTSGTLLINGSDASNYQDVLISTRLGNSEQAIVSGFGETITAYSQTAELTEGTAFTYETTEAVDGFELQMFQAAGHYQVTVNSGQVSRKSVEYEFRFRPVGQTAWTEDITITRDYINRGAHSWAIRRANLPNNIYEIELERITLDDDDPATDVGEYSQAVMNAVNEIRDFGQDYGGLALVGIKAIGSDQISGTPTFTSLVEGYKPWVWDGVSTTAPAFVRQYTRNPGEILPGLLLNKNFGTGHRLSVEDLYLPDFATLATHADESIDDGRSGTMARYKFDYVHDRSERAAGLIDKILATCNAKLRPVGNQIGVWVDKAETPSHLFSEGNIAKLEVSYLDTSRRFTKTNVSYLNKELDYDFDVASFENQTTTDDDFEEETVEIRGVTKPARAMRLAKRRQNNAQLLTKHVTFEAPVESVSLQVGDTFWLSSLSLSTTMISGRLSQTAAANTAVYFDEDITLEAATTYQVTIHGVRDSAVYLWSSEVTQAAGTYTAGTSISIVDMGFHSGQTPVVGDAYALGVQGEDLQAYRCLACPMDGENVRKIQGIEYNAAVYDDDPGPVPTSTDLYPDTKAIPADVSGLRVFEEARTLTSGDIHQTLVVSWSAANSWDQADVFYAESDGTDPVWTFAGRTGDQTIELGQFAKGTVIQVSVCPLSPQGHRKPPSGGVKLFHTIIGKLDGPGPVTNFIAGSTAEGLLFRWTDPVDADLDLIEVRQGAQWLGAQHLGYAQKGDCGLEVPMIIPHSTTPAYIVRTRNTSGVWSDDVVTETGAKIYSDTDEIDRTNHHTDGWTGTKTNLTVDGANLVSDAARTSFTYETADLDHGTLAFMIPTIEVDGHWVERSAEPGAPTLSDLTDNFRTLMTTAAEDSTITPGSDLGALLTPFGLDLGDHFKIKIERKLAGSAAALTATPYEEHRPHGQSFQWSKWRLTITTPGDDYKLYLTKMETTVYGREPIAREMDKLTTQGDFLYHDASGYVRLPLGAANTVLQSNGTDGRWTKITNSDIDTGTIESSAVTDDFAATAAYPSFGHTVYLNVSINAGSLVRGWIDATDDNLGHPLPSGSTFYPLRVYARAKTGSSAGTYDIRVGVRRIEAVSATSPYTDYELASTTSTSVSTWVAITDLTGTKTTPVGGSSIAGGSGYRLLFYVENKGTSPAALSSAKHTVTIEGVII